MAISLDHLVGADEESRRYVEAESASGPEIDNEFELRRGLHLKITRLLTFQDAIDVGARLRKRSTASKPYAIRPPLLAWKANGYTAASDAAP